MVVANHAGDLPLPVLVSPQMNEFRFSDIVGLAGVVESMNPNLHCPIVGNRIYLEGSGNEFPRNLAADVVLDGVDERLRADGQTRFVVVELQVVGNHGRQGCQIAVVVGVEQFSVQSLNLVEKGIGRGDGLRVGARERRSKQGGENEGG